MVGSTGVIGGQAMGNAAAMGVVAGCRYSGIPSGVLRTSEGNNVRGRGSPGNVLRRRAPRDQPALWFRR